MSRLWEDSQYTATMRFYYGIVYLKYMTHTGRQLNDTTNKHVLFALDLNASIIETHWCRISEILNVFKFQAKKVMQNKAELTSLIKKNLNFNVELDSTLKWRVNDRNTS
mgnify:FL=1